MRGNKSPDVGTPVRNAAERGVEGNGNVSLQRFPCGIHIPRPQKRGIPLHPGVTVAMQRIRTLIRPVQLRPFPVHAVANQARRDAERIAFVRPPSADAHGNVFAMCVPVAACRLLIKARYVARIVNGPTESVRENDHVHHGMKVLPVKLIKHFLGIGEDAGIPHKRTILGVPA